VISILVINAGVSFAGPTSSASKCKNPLFTWWDPTDAVWAEAVRDNDRKLRIYLVADSPRPPERASDSHAPPDEDSKKRVYANRHRPSTGLNVFDVTFDADSLQYSHRRWTYRLRYDDIERIDYRSGHKSLRKGAWHGAAFAAATTFWTGPFLIFTIPIGTGAGVGIAAVTPRWIPLYCARSIDEPGQRGPAPPAPEIAPSRPKPIVRSGVRVREQRPNLVGFEVRGRGMNPAFTYERFFTNDLGFGMGATAHHNAPIASLYLSVVRGDVHGLYLAGGATASLGNETLPDTRAPWAVTGSVGYQFQPYNGLLIRPLVTVFWCPDDDIDDPEDSAWFLGPGLTFGAAF
jgi:hypothetical protein